MAKTRITAYGDIDDEKSTLIDIVSGEIIPFDVKKGVLSFNISCAARWGRALALLKYAPASVEVSVSGNPKPLKNFMYAVRIMRKDRQPVHNTLPVEVTITNPAGKVRDDLSGVKIVENGNYVFSMKWPLNAKKGKWSITVKEKTSRTIDKDFWIVD